MAAVNDDTKDPRCVSENTASKEKVVKIDRHISVGLWASHHTRVRLEASCEAQNGVRAFVVEPSRDDAAVICTFSSSFVVHVKHFCHLARGANFEIGLPIIAIVSV